MIKKHKFVSIFIAVIFLLFLNANFSHALEIKQYPDLPWVSAPTENCVPSECLPSYISYFFGLGIYLAGVLAVISLVIGGIRLMTSAGNPGARGDANERIIGAILGLILTVSSIIILRTINPTLITPTLTPAGGVAGIFYTNGTEEKQAPDSEEDTSSIPSGYNEIFYKCSKDGGGTGPALLIWKFPKKNFDGYKNAIVERKKCGEKTSANDYPSFKMAFETPGVYYFLGTGCNGFMSRAQLSDTQEIAEPFKSEMRSVKIINDTINRINYGAILHSEINFRGSCSLPLGSYNQESDCGDFPAPISSVNIFAYNNESKEASKTSGNGIVFYSKPFGYNTGQNSGYKNLSPDNIKEAERIIWYSAPDKIDFSESYNYINVPEEEKKLCKTFKDCPGSIKVQGHYLVALYSKQTQGTGSYCQVFNKDVPNLKAEEAIAVEGRILEAITVIPVK